MQKLQHYLKDGRTEGCHNSKKAKVLIEYLSGLLNAEDKRQLTMMESSNNENVRFREILEKPVDRRSEAEIDEVVDIIHKINFF